MEGISVSGIGSGLDINGLVDQLIQAEAAPTTSRLDNKEVGIQASISALGTFRGSLSDFRDSLGSLRTPQDIRKISVTSSDEDIVSVSADVQAQQGDFEVRVLQLASSHRLMTQRLDSELEPLGAGNLSIQFGSMDNNGQFTINPKSRVRNINITDANNSLRGIKQAINKENIGVRASIINDGQGFRLVLSGEATGTDNSIRILVNDADNNDTDQIGLSRFSYDPLQANGTGLNLIETEAAQDALVRIDGIDITSSSNTISDAIEGVTLHVHAAGEGKSVRVTAAFDHQAVIESISGFVSSYNELVTSINALTGVNPETNEAGPLAGDASIRSIATQIRRVIGSSFAEVNNGIVSLSDIGIDTRRNGTLTIDAAELSRAVSNNLTELSKIFARAGSASDQLISFSDAADNTAAGSYAVFIDALASNGRYISAETNPGGKNITEGKNKLAIKVDGVTSETVSIPVALYANGNELADVIQRQINSDANLLRENKNVSVEFLRGHFVITSDTLGSRSRVEIISADTDIRASGIDPGKGVDGVDAKGTIGGVEAEANGAVLSGKGKAEGIKIEILGGNTGARGEVSFSLGVAEQLHTQLNALLGSGGLISTRTEGLNDRVEDINRQREQLSRRLAVSERRLVEQFSSLDSLLGRMRNTSEFLSNQLSGLPNATGRDKQK